jgi:acetyl-CoA carboxylase/biotin carboxylase 1
VWFPDSARKTADALEDFHRERLPCFILANWRGFSGGMRDMYDEVLKFGASIVDNLRVYTAPVFVYIPPHGELRGGAWVVVDPVINSSGVVQMFCDETARGGILEPSGVVEIKFREADVRAAIRRSDPQIISMLASDDAAGAKKREAHLLPLYTDVAVHFADLHDKPGRMVAKKTVTAVVPWRDSRRIFSAKLERRLQELDLANSIVARGECATLPDALSKLRAEYSRADYDTNDNAVAAWIRDAAKARSFRPPPALVPGGVGHSSSPRLPPTSAESIQQAMRSLSSADRQKCLAGLLDDDELAQAIEASLARKKAVRDAKRE